MAIQGGEEIVTNVALAGEQEVVAGLLAIGSAGVLAFQAISQAAQGNNLAAFTASVGAAASAVAVLTAGLFEWARSSAALVGNQARLADINSTSLEQISSMVGALASAGAETDRLTTSLRFFAHRVEQEWPKIQKQVRSASDLIIRNQLNVESAMLAQEDATLKVAQAQLGQVTSAQAVVNASLQIVDAQLRQQQAAIGLEQADLNIIAAELQYQQTTTALRNTVIDLMLAEDEAAQRRANNALSIASATIDLAEAEARAERGGRALTGQQQRRFAAQRANLAVEQARQRLADLQAQRQREAIRDEQRRVALQQQFKQLKLQQKQALIAERQAALGLLQAQQQMRTAIAAEANARNQLAQARLQTKQFELQERQAALQKREADAQLSERLKKQREDEANSVEAAAKFVQDTIKGLDTSGQIFTKSTDNVIKGLIATAAAGGTSLKAAADSLGDFGASAPKVFDTFLTLADFMKNLRDETLKQSLMTELMSRGFSQTLVEAMSQGGASLEATAARLRAMGFELTSIREKGMESDEFFSQQFRRTLGELSAMVKILGTQIGIDLARPFTQVLKVIGELLAENRQAIRDWARAIIDQAIPAVTALLNLISGRDLSDRMRLKPDQILAVREWEASFRRIGESIRSFITFVQTAFQVLSTVFGVVMFILNGVANAINFLSGGLTQFTGAGIAIGLFVAKLLGLFRLLGTFAPALGTLTGALIVFGRVLVTVILPALARFTLLLLTNPFTLMIAGITILIGLLTYLAFKLLGVENAFTRWVDQKRDDAWNWIKEKWDFLANYLPQKWAQLKAFLNEWIGTPTANAWEWIKAKWDEISNWFAQKMEQLRAAMRQSIIYRAVAGAWNWITNTLPEIVNRVGQYLQELYQRVLAVVTTPIQNAWTWITQTWQSIVNTVSQWLSQLRQAIQNSVIFQAIAGAWEWIRNNIGSVVQFVQQQIAALQAAINRLFTPVPGAWQWMIDSFRTVFQTLSGWIDSLIAKFREMIGLKGQAESASPPIDDTGGAGIPLARGGHVRGPGSWTSDSILARLSDNEFVMQARATAHYGVQFMRALNAMAIPKSMILKALRGFNLGGLVRAPQPMLIPAFATGGQVRASMGALQQPLRPSAQGPVANVFLKFPNMRQPFGPFQGPLNVVKDLQKAVNMDQLTTTNNVSKPRWQR